MDNGFAGTEAEWLASLAGATGATGPKGDKGDKGDTGAAGSDAKQIIRIQPLITPNENYGKMVVYFNDGTTINTELKIFALLPTGENGALVGRDLQGLSTLLYDRITALESRVAALEALTRITVDGTTYTYQLDVQNGKPVLILTEVQ